MRSPTAAVGGADRSDCLRARRREARATLEQAEELYKVLGSCRGEKRRDRACGVHE
jgi:hypothetical protein